MLPSRQRKTIKRDGIVKSQKPQNHASKKQYDTKLGTSFSRLFTRTTKGALISRDGTWIHGAVTFPPHRRLPESTRENA
jgi:hypothetical protein